MYSSSFHPEQRLDPAPRFVYHTWSDYDVESHHAHPPPVHHRPPFGHPYERPVEKTWIEEYAHGHHQRRPLRVRTTNCVQACVNCRKSHLACDTSRPCRRCVATGKEDTCHDLKQKKRGRRPKNYVPPSSDSIEEDGAPKETTTLAEEIVTPPASPTTNLPIKDEADMDKVVGKETLLQEDVGKHQQDESPVKTVTPPLVATHTANGTDRPHKIKAPAKQRRSDSLSFSRIKTSSAMDLPLPEQRYRELTPMSMSPDMQDGIRFNRHPSLSFHRHDSRASGSLYHHLEDVSYDQRSQSSRNPVYPVYKRVAADKDIPQIYRHSQVHCQPESDYIPITPLYARRTLSAPPSSLPSYQPVLDSYTAMTTSTTYNHSSWASSASRDDAFARRGSQRFSISSLLHDRHP